MKITESNCYETINKEVTIDQVPFKVVDGVKVVSICDLMVAFLGTNWWDWDLTIDEETQLVNDFILRNNTHYYGRCKENFFHWQAVDEAKEAGKSIVVVENYS